MKKYELAQSTISTILKAGSAAIDKAGTIGRADHRKRVRGAAYADGEEALYQWFLTTHTQNLPISEPILAAKVKRFAFLLRGQELEPGRGWIQRFKDRHGIVYKNMVGEAVSLDSQAKEKWLEMKLPDLLELYSERDIYNGDETAFFFSKAAIKDALT